MENKRKHLEFIQNIISRMAGNLFFLRGWTITLIATLLALCSNNANHALIYVAYFPVFVFWILDGYFLSQERLFRALYDHVRALDEKDIDFSMDTSKLKEDRCNRWIYSIFSSTLLFFYLPLIVIMQIVIQLIR